MLELRRIGSFDIRQRRIRLHDPVRDETVHLSYISTDRLMSFPQCHTYAGQIPIQAKSIKVSTAKYQGAEILSDRLMQTRGRGEV